MHREYHRWYSPSLNRDMELLIFGYGGARVLVFPTSQGRFFEWEDRGMMAFFQQPIEHGYLQFYCVDSVDAESWYCKWAHPSGRAQRHQQYDAYLYHEVLPLSSHKNRNPFLMTLGASFGAYHAMNFGLRHPDQVRRIIGLSGAYDIRSFTDGYVDGMVYQHNPVQYIPNEQDAQRLALLRQMQIIIAGGRDDRLINSSRQMNQVLWDKGIWAAYREWGGWYHDWNYWQEMLAIYINGPD